jgi:nitrogen-specific signal transduction histidine kinase
MVVQIPRRSLCQMTVTTVTTTTTTTLLQMQTMPMSTNSKAQHADRLRREPTAAMARGLARPLLNDLSRPTASYHLYGFAYSAPMEVLQCK